MKKFITILFIGLLAFQKVTDTSSVLKWKITDLESYIAACDHPLIINFWSTTCAPCVTEIPYLQSTVEQFQKDSVELILVSLDRPGSYPGRIASFAAAHDYHVRLVWLDETNPGYYRPRIYKTWSGGLPSSLFVYNKTHYRWFYDRQLTVRQVSPAILQMIGGPAR